MLPESSDHPWMQDTTPFPTTLDPGHAVLKNIDLDDFFFGKLSRAASSS